MVFGMAFALALAVISIIPTKQIVNKRFIFVSPVNCSLFLYTFAAESAQLTMFVSQSFGMNSVPLIS
jgi:hypothetical protein